VASCVSLERCVDLVDPVELVLSGVDGIRFCAFSEQDVVRHRLVRDIITAYDRAEAPAAKVSERDGDDGATR